MPHGQPFLDITPWVSQIRPVFSRGPHIGLHRVGHVIERLGEIGGEARRAAAQGDDQRASQVLRALLEVCATEGFGSVDDSYGIFGDFYRTCLQDYARTLEEWPFDRSAFFTDALDLFLAEDYGFADETIALMLRFCQADQEYDTLERLALELRDKLKGEENYKHQKVVNLLLKLYDQRGDDASYLMMCDEKEATGWQRWVWKAEKLEALGRVDEARATYREGLGQSRHQRFLTDKLAELEQRLGRPESALELMIARFGDLPSRSDYDRIQALALSLDCWHGALRDRLLAVLVERGHLAEVVPVLLEEGQVLRALQIARAIPPGASYAGQVRMRVAAVVSEEDPRAAIELYQEAVAPYLSKVGRRNYEQITLYLRLMRPLYERLGALDEWQAGVDDLRRRYRGRKVLMEMLDALCQ